MKTIVTLSLLIGTSFIKAQESSVTSTTIAYRVVSKSATEVVINPKYDGGVEAMNAFIVENLSYPSEFKMSGQYGKVFVAFKVMEDGTLEDIEISRGISEGLDAEALRVVHLMPKWIPGTKNDKAVPMRYYIPVEFKAKNY